MNQSFSIGVWWLEGGRGVTPIERWVQMCSESFLGLSRAANIWSENWDLKAATNLMDFATHNPGKLFSPINQKVRSPRHRITHEITGSVKMHSSRFCFYFIQFDYRICTIITLRYILTFWRLSAMRCPVCLLSERKMIIVIIIDDVNVLCMASGHQTINFLCGSYWIIQ